MLLPSSERPLHLWSEFGESRCWTTRRCRWGWWYLRLARCWFSILLLLIERNSWELVIWPSTGGRPPPALPLWEGFGSSQGQVCSAVESWEMVSEAPLFKEGYSRCTYMLLSLLLNQWSLCLYLWDLVTAASLLESSWILSWGFGFSVLDHECAGVGPREPPKSWWVSQDVLHPLRNRRPPALRNHCRSPHQRTCSTWLEATLDLHTRLVDMYFLPNRRWLTSALTWIILIITSLCVLYCVEAPPPALLTYYLLLWRVSHVRQVRWILVDLQSRRGPQPADWGRSRKEAEAVDVALWWTPAETAVPISDCGRSYSDQQKQEEKAKVRLHFEEQWAQQLLSSGWLKEEYIRIYIDKLIN